MTFLSDTTLTLAGTYQEILIITDAQFASLDIVDANYFEGSEKLRGTNPVTFLAGMKLEGRFTNIRLLSGSILLR